MFDSLKLRKRVLEVEEEMATVKRTLASLQTEWLDTLDRLKSMMGRIVKDRARAEAARGPSPEANLSDEDIAAGTSSLSPQQNSINQRILARRNRMSGGTQ